ncbi:MAG TPA: porin [bacterium]|nr:porin [bacterium]
MTVRSRLWFAIIGFYAVSLAPSHTSAVVVNLTGKVYSAYNYDIVSRDNEFRLTRIYLGYAGTLTPNTRFQILSDISPSATGYRLLMRNAFLHWEPIENGTVRFGLFDSNAFDIQRKTWGLRYLAKTIMNLNGFAPSADLGIGFEYRIPWSLSISAVISNGGGYEALETDKYKRFHLRFLSGPTNLSLVEGVNKGMYLSVEPIGPQERIYTYAGFAGFHFAGFWSGLEFGQQRTATSDSTHTLASIYGKCRIIPALLFFSRMDISQQGATPAVENFLAGDELIILGLELSSFSGVKVAPNILHYYPQNGDNQIIARLNLEFKW